ncbi:cytochrome P450 [Sphingomonas sp. BIUV-7]|uniref:Cytochrome P450 n=1 Tax=Sphingomonas natans TaxID=3063330 RepID=A0ABT8Y846_9SPHN|nr:cytochrome P450 [Sphingomonas sp. BIUV-7]MDO6414501.1 cytochrome P450 [Sphingomonas sp. BIUV-7]
MTELSTKTAFHYDPYSEEARRDPQSLYPTLREHHRAYYIPDYDAYAISRYDDVWAAFMDAKNFTESEGQVFPRSQMLVHHRGDPPKASIDPKTMFLFLDPPVHSSFRTALASPFMKGNVGKLEPQITALIRRQLDLCIAKGRFDLNADFASYISVGATAILMGLPVEDSGAIIDLVNRMVARDPQKPGPTADGIAARGEIIDFLTVAIQRRRREEGEASRVIDPLIHGDMIGRPQTDTEIANDILGILVGGTETVPKVFSGGLLELQRRPEQLAAVRADIDAHAPLAFEEMLRFNAPAQWFGRTAKNPVEVAGVTVEPGQRVMLLIAAANRDPREFDDPDAFIWNRKARRMLSFGVGPHFCIGIHLARLEGQIMLKEFLRATRDFRIEPDAGEWAVSEFQIGWTKLPVTVVPA